MSPLPPTVASHLDSWIRAQLAPAWLELDGEGRLARAGGALDRYGLVDLEQGAPVTARLAFLEGLVPSGPEPTQIECLAITPDSHADVLVFGDPAATWVLLLDATVPAQQRRVLQQRGNELALLHDELDRLVQSMMPAQIARRLKAAETTIADAVPDASVLFADIHDFTRLTAELEATEAVHLLSGIFSEFDELAESHGIVRIKTSGDTYECVSGVPESRPGHARAAAELALDMQAAITRFTDRSGRAPSLRIGIHSGPLVAGVIGRRRLAYDVWGKTVRIASHMEIYGMPGCIQVSAATCAHLRDDYLLEQRGEFFVPGEGDVVTYLLTGRRFARKLESGEGLA